MNQIFQDIENTTTLKELEEVAFNYFKQNPYTHGREIDGDITRALFMKHLSLKSPKRPDEKDILLQAIREAKSMKELDAIALTYYSKWGSHDQHQLSPAFVKRESELLLQIEKEIAMPVVKLDLSKKKESKTAEVISILHKTTDIKCGCPTRYGVPCIHRTSFDGIVPDDYHECDECGVDHKYDARLANEVHSKLEKN